MGSNPTPSVAASGSGVFRLYEVDGKKKDGWPSGLRRTIGNRVGESPRGFESHPVRVVGSHDGAGRTRERFGAWLSPVERCVRVAEVPGSNPGAPIRCAAKRRVRYCARIGARREGSRRAAGTSCSIIRAPDGGSAHLHVSPAGTCPLSGCPATCRRRTSLRITWYESDGRTGRPGFGYLGALAEW